MAHILIVDDDELIAEITSETLIDRGHACGWVTDAIQAWDLLHTGRRPNLVLLDQDMPGMSGITLLRKLRGSPLHYDLPVVMFTAMRGEEDETQAIYAGAQAYIRKPYHPNEMIGQIERVLAKRDGGPRHKDLKTVMAESSGYVRAGQEAARRLI